VTEPVARRIVAALAGKRGKATSRLADVEVEPTLLSLFCRELNNRRISRGESHVRFDDDDSVGADILSAFYHRCLQDISPKFRVFLEERLITASGLRDTEPVDNAIRVGISRAEIESLVQRRLIRIEEWSGVQRIELVHDVLTDVIKNARDARLTVEAAATVASAAAASLRRAQGEAEQRRRRRMRFVALVVGGVFVASGALLARLVSTTRAGANWQGPDDDPRADASAEDLVTRRLAMRAIVGDPVEGILQLSQRLRLQNDDEVARGALLNELLWVDWPGRTIGVARAMPLPSCAPGRVPRVVRWSRFNGIVAWYDVEGKACTWHSGGLKPSPFRGAWTSLSTPELDADGLRAVIESQRGIFEVVPLGAGKPFRIDRRTPPHIFRNGSSEMVLTISPGNVLEFGNLLTRLKTGDRIDLPGAVRDVAALGGRVALLGEDGATRIADLASRRVDVTISDDCARSIEASEAAGELLTVCPHRLRVRDGVTGALVSELVGSEPDWARASFSPDGSRVAAATADGRLRVWDAKTGLPISWALQHGAPVVSLDFSPGGQRLVTAGEDGQLKIWDLPAGTSSEELPDVAEAIVGWRITPDGTTEPVPNPQGVLDQKKQLFASAPEIGPTTASVLRWLLMRDDSGGVQSVSPFAGLGAEPVAARPEDGGEQP
jgi:hypothetical protein